MEKFDGVMLRQSGKIVILLLGKSNVVGMWSEYTTLSPHLRFELQSNRHKAA